MRPKPPLLLCVLALFTGCSLAQTSTANSTADPLHRTNPRSAVTGFLQACHNDDYVAAAQYLDLKLISAKKRALQGPALAKKLEEILNSDSRFNVLRLSQAPEGNLTDDADPLLEHIVSISNDEQELTLTLSREDLTPGSSVWLFSSASVVQIPAFTLTTSKSAIEARLPRFLVSTQMLETPIWKWLALCGVAFVVVSLFRVASRVLVLAVTTSASRLKSSGHLSWIQSVLQPWLVFISAMAFGVAEQFLDPSALSRLYIGRAILLVVVWSFAWCISNLIDLLLSRINSLLDPRQRMVSHSMIYMGRRAAKVAVFVIAMIVVLDNWGYNMTTMIAGLGVGGIAIALAAQTTIANVFGGVSVISDQPVMVGDFGNFGGVMGTVEDIGMRSTRVRTLNRTMMSIPNSAFAGMNLENYALRDKILFNPTLQVKRGTPKAKIGELMQALTEMLKHDPRIELGPSPIRLASLSAASLAMEIFAYTLTDDINEFYKIQAALFLEIDEKLAAAGVELV